MQSEHNQPDPIRSRIISPASLNSSSPSPPGSQGQSISEQEKIIAWKGMIAESSSKQRDPGAIARAEARLADPNYPDDEILETVAMNIMLRENL